MTIKFFVPGPMPGLNEIISAAKKWIPWLEKKGKRVFEITKMKEEWDNRVCTYALAEYNKHYKGQPRPYDEPVIIRCQWIERDNRRDPDNIFGGGTKFLMDGLVRAGFLHNDTRRWIHGIEHYLAKPNKYNPGVWVELIRNSVNS